MAAAELKLQVGLDLAFFRQQLAQLGNVAVGYQLPINIKFDRLGVQRELNSLEANINRRKYRLEVATNIAAEIKNAGTLAKALRGLDNAIQKNKGVANRTGGGAAGSVVDASKLEKSLKTATRPVLESVYNEMDRLGIRMAKAANDAGTTTNESLRAAILSGIPQVTADMAQGLAKGINPLMKINGQKGAKLFIEAWKDAAGIASPSKVFKALGEFSADGLEIGFINGLKDFENKSVDEIRKIVALLKFELAKISDVSMAPAMSRSTGARGSQAYMSPIGPLPHGSREPWAFSQGGYQPFMAQPGQARGAGASRAGGPSIMGTTSSPSMLGASFPALPSAGMTGGGGAYRQAQLQSRMAEAYARSAAREASVLGESQMYARVSGQVPLGNPAPRLPSGNQGGALAPRSAPSGGQGGAGGFGGFANAMAGIQLPGAGLIRELGGEFAMAAKQVLLFGTAYKALAFLTDFPSKVGEAVGQLQTFRNTLTAITGGGQEFGKSNQFILDLVEKYNIPLQSARDGFAKLYASMAPAGFKGDEIRKIFTGISQGAATFGMSADKVDRVNYAFAQMASKGQVMSEELKGQLGDVLPGAVAIFAEAAGFTGPEAMVKFTKAMEDGQYKGKAMKQLLLNVGVVMKKEFGPGAEGAARTFQGIMNRMQNATAKLYEAFEPMAIGFANQVVLPMAEGLKITADGFNAFFTGQKATTKGGAELASKLQELKPTFEGLANNIKSVIDRVVDLSKAFVPLLELGTKLLATPLAGFLAQTYVSVLLLNSAFTVLGGRFAVTSFVAYFSRLNSALVLTRAQMIVTGGAANAMNLRILATGPAAVGATTAMGQVTLAVRAMWLAMTGPVGLAILGIAAVTAALYTMHEPSREYLNSIPARYKSFWEDLATQASASASKVQAAWQSVQSFFGQIIKNIVQIFQENIGKLPSFFQEKIVLITAIFERLMPIFGGVTQWIEANWQAMIASMINSSNPLLNIAKTLGVDVGAAYVKAMAGPPPGSKNQLAPGQFTPAGGVSFDAQGKPIGASLSPFVPEVKLPPIPGATGATGGKGSGADDAKRIAEQIKQQLKLAQDLKFEQQNRLTLLRAENDFTKAFTGFSIQRLEIERRYGELLEKSQSKEETAALQESRAAEYKQSRLTLQQRINELLKQAQAPLDDAVESIKNQAAFEREYGELIKNGTNPELAKQLIAIRKGYDESVKLLEPALAAAQAAVTKATAEGASASEIRKYREELERIEAIRKGLAGKKTEGEAAAQEVSTPVFGSKIKTGLDAAREELAKLIDVENILVGAANSIGDAFGSAFKGIVDGSMTAQQALGSLFQNVGNYFVDLVAKMIAEYLKMQLIEGIMNLVSMLSPGFGSGIAPGPVAKSAGVKYSSTKMGPGFANGGIAPGGFRAFATGGIVTGPTLGLVGEGKYNEAVIPLPDGKSVPVDLGGMSGGGAITSNIVINMNSDGQSSSNANGSNSAELGRKIEGAVKQVMVAELRPGGILAGRR